MEKKIMAIKIIGLIIGILVLVAGIYYLVKEKHDQESKKIYTVVSVIGAVIAVVCAIMLIIS
jgi:4-hydroxybenzoate polyprenyltransferase